MIKKLSTKIILILISIVILICFLLINSSINNDRHNYLKSLLSDDQKYFIKKYIFPYKMVSQQQELISQQQELISQQKEMLNKTKQVFTILELDTKEKGLDIQIKESDLKLSNDLILNKYKLISGFYSGINSKFPGSGYLDFYEDNIFILSARGIIAFRKGLNNDEENFKQIKNNINDFIGLNQFKKYQYKQGSWFSLKDLLIFNGKIFISYTEEINDDCWNTSIIYGDLNYKNIKFTKLFSPKKCIHIVNNIDNEFNAHQSGGRIIPFDDKNILLSVGDYRSRYLAQDKESLNGKIIKINIEKSDFKIISMGHRNPQGLYYDKEKNIILETEHGPKGGDEINIIDADKINEDEIQNFGWPISSAGEHYGERNEYNQKKYDKYPLYKSHNDHGYIEPLKSFVPSIGISEIHKIGESKYVVSSLRDKSIYFFELNNKKQLINLNRIEVFERIRDLGFKDDKLYLFMEDTASIGVLDIK